MFGQWWLPWCGDVPGGCGAGLVDVCVGFVDVGVDEPLVEGPLVAALAIAAPAPAKTPPTASVAAMALMRLCIGITS